MKEVEKRLPSKERLLLEDWSWSWVFESVRATNIFSDHMSTRPDGDRRKRRSQTGEGGAR